ncbi:hypothetical protein EIN_354860 [Entamoeba invadens IP1]|uniref:Uncharacterized protein n=1 Tax=Entamoeba invadens IP1 TaxID=370355 RepID=L7FLP5_ENTIV|nr:hypothetical protein EIN_354860 [Entamoeba invadens IP1]ELP87164.1 hypothetical protein EIN_354860 [Entamoeba invadens IP1]|eukprot:XP_004253935.1 hypothetical protein EIN_354860 [Entamoeba invadens IP1]
MKSTCVVTDENCDTFQANSDNTEVKCVVCKDRYYLTDDFKCSKCSDSCSTKCLNAPNNCEQTNCNDFVCMRCSTKDKCDTCYGYDLNKVNSKGTCGSVVCANYLFDLKCTSCLSYSEETIHPKPYSDPDYRLPKYYNMYLSDENFECTQSSKNDDMNWLWITLGVVGGLLIIAIIIVVIIIITVIIKKKKNSEYQDISK